MDSINSPISRLLDDILVLIFEIHVDILPRQLYSGSPNQLNISHVCRRWRHIALGTASLWTDFKIRSLASLSFAETFSRTRSKGALLRVDIRDWKGAFGPCNDEDPPQENGGRLTRFVASNIHRISHLYITTCAHWIVKLRRYDLPVPSSLVYLQLTRLRSCDVAPDDLTVHFRIQTPHLRSISVEDIGLASQLFDTRAVYSAVSYYHSKPTSPRAILNDFGTLPNVVQLRYGRTLQGGSVTYGPHDIVTLGSLEILSMTIHGNGNLLFRQLSCLRLPVLRKLYFTFGRDTSDNHVFLIQFLESLGTLTCLSFELPTKATISLLQHMRKRSNQPVSGFLPCLHTLGITCLPRFDQPPISDLHAALHAMALDRTTRRSGTTALSKLCIVPPLDGTTADTLRAMGIEVVGEMRGHFGLE